MEPGNFPRKFEIEDAKGQPSRPVIEAGTVESWSSFPSGLEIRDADNTVPAGNRWVRVETVTDWIQISTERTRRHIAYSVLGLLVLWVIADLAALFVWGDIRLLLYGLPLTVPIACMMRYYFFVEKREKARGRTTGEKQKRKIEKRRDGKK